MIETLETRQHFDVTAAIDGDTVTFTGTSAADALRVNGSSANEIFVEGLGSTTINGRARFDIPSTVEAATFVLGAGNDYVNVGDSTVWDGDIAVLGGTGDDRVSLPAPVRKPVGNVFFNGGNGNDVLGIVGRQINGRVDFEGGAGRDRVYLDDVQIGGRFTVRDLDGPTVIQATDTAINRDAVIDTGNGVDRLFLLRLNIKQTFVVRARGGDDNFTAVASTFGTLSVKLFGDAGDFYYNEPTAVSVIDET